MHERKLPKKKGVGGRGEGMGWGVGKEGERHSGKEIQKRSMSEIG